MLLPSPASVAQKKNSRRKRRSQKRSEPAIAPTGGRAVGGSARCLRAFGLSSFAPACGDRQQHLALASIRLRGFCLWPSFGGRTAFVGEACA